MPRVFCCCQSKFGRRCNMTSWHCGNIFVKNQRSSTNRTVTFPVPPVMQMRKPSQSPKLYFQGTLVVAVVASHSCHSSVQQDGLQPQNKRQAWDLHHMQHGMEPENDGLNSNGIPLPGGPIFSGSKPLIFQGVSEHKLQGLAARLPRLPMQPSYRWPWHGLMCRWCQSWVFVKPETILKQPISIWGFPKIVVPPNHPF